MSDILIRLLQQEDYSELYRVIEKNRRRLKTYFPKTTGAVLDLDTARKFVQLKIRQARTKEQFYFVILHNGTAEIIGSIILKNIDWSIPKGELAYFIDHEHEGRGYTSYAVRWLTEYAFDQLRMEKLYIKFDPENAASKRVAIKSGFQKEGHMKREFRTGYGLLTDVERYGLLK